MSKQRLEFTQEELDILAIALAAARKKQEQKFFFAFDKGFALAKGLRAVLLKIEELTRRVETAQMKLKEKENDGEETGPAGNGEEKRGSSGTEGTGNRNAEPDRQTKFGTE